MMIVKSKSLFVHAQANFSPLLIDLLTIKDTEQGIELQYNPEITVLKGPANFGLYWRELLLVGYYYDTLFSQFFYKIYNVHTF